MLESFSFSSRFSKLPAPRRGPPPSSRCAADGVAAHGSADGRCWGEVSAEEDERMLMAKWMCEKGKFSGIKSMFFVL